MLKPGNTIKDVVTAIDSAVKATGYVMKLPVGHLCGADMVEVRVSPCTLNRCSRPGRRVIIHPTVCTPDLKNQFFWGETYLITKDGCERLNKSRRRDAQRVRFRGGCSRITSDCAFQPG